MTPPLKLKLRGLTEELYRRFTRSCIDIHGRDNLDMLTMNEKLEIMKGLLPNINAKAYVTDWSDAQYPNGTPMAYASDDLAVFMRKDEFLRNFISEEARKLAPDWSNG